MLYCAGGTSAAELAAGGTIGGHVLRRVDILGDVRPVPEVVSEPDSLLPPPPESEARLLWIPVAAA